MVSVIEPLIIYGCLPSWYGPSKPNFLMRAIKTRRETGFSLGICLLEFCLGRHPKTRNGQLIAQPKNKPPLQCVKQVGATFFKRTAGCPDSAKRFDFRVKTLSVVYHFISRLGKKRVYKILYHRPMISQKRLPFTLRG